MTTAISIRSVVKGYGDVRAVDGISLDIDEGETLALLGPNGAGKSTTIGMLLGLVAPDAGTVRVAGETPHSAVAHGRIAAMLQDTGLMPGVTVRELIGLGNRLYPHAIPVDEALDLAGLRDHAKRRVDKLSGGQAQRVRFALAIVANPDVLLLDEPTRALDVHARSEFWRAMRAYAASGRTVLFATHYLDEVTENADRVVVMARGRIVADGPPQEIRATTGTSTVRLTTGATVDGLPGVVRTEYHGSRVVLHTTDADATVRALSTSDIDWRDIEVSPASLDESFLALTNDTYENEAESQK